VTDSTDDPVQPHLFVVAPFMSTVTDILCTQCGLCCDGTLFADVELSGRAEATGLEILGLEVEDGDSGSALLVQPCRALHGRRCSIYAPRPKCCRTFECRLLQEVGRGVVSVERAEAYIADALGQIGRVRELLAQLGQGDEGLPLKERCADALAVEAGADTGLRRKRTELEAAMAAVERSIRATFL